MEDMGIWQPDKLLIFIGFVIPGFVSLKVYELLASGTSRESSKQIIDAITYSCINYAILFPAIYWVETHSARSTHPVFYALFYALVLLVAPATWPCIWMWLRRTQLAQRHFPHPTERPWDHVFKQRKHYWIIATLRDGTKVGGRYAASSFVSSAPAQEQIYLEEAWEINGDGGFDRCRSNSHGILIMGSDLLTLEFFKMEYVDGRQ